MLQAVGTFNSKFKQVVNMELAIKTFVVRRWSGYFQCQSSCNRDAVELKNHPYRMQWLDIRVTGPDAVNSHSHVDVHVS